MEKEDENLLVDRRDSYMKTVRDEALISSVKITQWEWEEIELAYEAGFQAGFVAGYQSLRNQAREQSH